MKLKKYISKPARVAMAAVICAMLVQVSVDKYTYPLELLLHDIVKDSPVITIKP